MSREIVDKNKEREKYRKQRGLGFRHNLKECAGCGHIICRCSDRQRRHETNVRGSCE
jgi:hypothetical protein